MQIEYRDDVTPDIETARDLYRRSTLGERRPIARSLTDFTWVAYLADLAVDAAIQRQGIGELRRRRARFVGQFRGRVSTTALDIGGTV